jgi:hypothetical protein
MILQISDFHPTVIGPLWKDLVQNPLLQWSLDINQQEKTNSTTKGERKLE